MLSIVISSYQSHYFTALEKNIADTCGIPYEIIKIDNPGLMGTCAAYNTGANLAKHELLLFIHEDIKFETKNWGFKLVKHLQIKNAGIIGIAGGTYVPHVPLGWFAGFKYAFIHIRQREKNGVTNLVKTFSTDVQKVIALDGVLMSMNKNIFKQFYFDETLKNYHGYDTELSLRVAKKFPNYVVSDILIEHFSSGNPDKEWFDGNMYIRRKLGSKFKHATDRKLEYELYVAFISEYLDYHPKSFKNILLVLSFFPIFKINKNKYFKLFQLTFSKFYG